MWTSALFGANKLEFFGNLWCVRMDKEGRIESCGPFLDKEREGINHLRFYSDVFVPTLAPLG